MSNNCRILMSLICNVNTLIKGLEGEDGNLLWQHRVLLFVGIIIIMICLSILKWLFWELYHNIIWCSTIAAQSFTCTCWTVQKSCCYLCELRETSCISHLEKTKTAESITSQRVHSNRQHAKNRENRENHDMPLGRRLWLDPFYCYTPPGSPKNKENHYFSRKANIMHWTHTGHGVIILTAASSYGAWSPTTNMTGHLVDSWGQYRCRNKRAQTTRRFCRDSLEGTVAVDVQVPAAVEKLTNTLFLVWGVLCVWVCAAMLTCCRFSRRARCWWCWRLWRCALCGTALDLCLTTAPPAGQPETLSKWATFSHRLRRLYEGETNAIQQ